MQSQRSVNTSPAEKSEKYLAGFTCEEQQKYDEAIKHYIAAINAKGGDVAADERLIWLCSQTNLSKKSLLKIEKADLFKLIKSIKSVDRQVMLLLQCLNKQTLLGKRFWQPDWGGMRDAALDRGELDNICQYLIQINAGYKEIIEEGEYVFNGTFIFDWAKKNYYDDRRIVEYRKAILLDPINTLKYREEIGAEYYKRARNILFYGAIYKTGQPKRDRRDEHIAILTDYAQAINYGDERANVELKSIFQEKYFDKEFQGYVVNFWNPKLLNGNDLFEIIMTLNEAHRADFLLLCFDTSTKLGERMLDDNHKPDIKAGVFKKIYDELIRIDSNYHMAITQLLDAQESNQLNIDYCVQVSFDYCEQGKQSLKQGKIDEAIAAYTQAVAANPRYGQPCIALGDIYAQEKKDDAQALIYYTQALTLTPSEELYDKQGISYSKLGNHEAALNSFTEGLRLNPDRITTHHNVGYIYHAMGEYDKAVVAYKKAIHIASGKDRPGVSRHKIFQNIGSVYYDLGKYDKALKNFNLSLSHRNWVKSSEVGKIYYKRGLTNEALKKYEEAVDDYIHANEGGYTEATNYLCLFLQKDLPLSDNLNKKIHTHLEEALKKTDEERLKQLDVKNVDHLSPLSDSDITKKMTAIRKILHEDAWPFYWEHRYDETLLKIYYLSFDKNKDDKTKYQEISILVEEASSGMHPLRADDLDYFYKYFYQIESAKMAQSFADNFYISYKYSYKNKGDGYLHVRVRKEFLSLLNAIIELDPKEKYYMARAVFLFKEIEKRGEFTQEERDSFVDSLKMAKQERQFVNFLECQQFARHYEILSLFQAALDCYIEFSRHHHRDICCLPMARLYTRLDNHREALWQYHWFYIISENSIQNEQEIKEFLNNLIEKNGFDDGEQNEVQVTKLRSDGDMKMLKDLMDKLSLQAIYDFKKKMQRKMPDLVEKLKEITSSENFSATFSAASNQISSSFFPQVGTVLGYKGEEKKSSLQLTRGGDPEGL